MCSDAVFTVGFDPAAWRQEATPARIQEWMGQRKICPACGQPHQIETRRIAPIRLGSKDICRQMEDLGLTGRCVVVMDERTQKAAGAGLLDDLGSFAPQKIVFDLDVLHADEQALGTVLANLTGRPDFFISCGGGTLTDITRHISLMTGIPFVSFATASSVDGFASGNTPLIIRGFKRTIPGVAPQAIFYDPQVLAEAPSAMTAAGFGDISAKIIALLDWRLACAVEGDSYCPLIAALVDRAVSESINQARQFTTGLTSRTDLCRDMLETLCLTGMAMQMAGCSRPASSAEHQVSHLLEMRDIQKHKAGSLHGDKVGIGTLMVLAFYQRLFAQDSLPPQQPTLPAAVWEKEVRRVFGPAADQVIAANRPEPTQGAAWERQAQRVEKAMCAFGYAQVHSFRTLLPQIRDLIQALGGPIRPDQLGYSVEDTYDALAYGKEINPKLTIARLAERFGWLYSLAEEIATGVAQGRFY